MQHIAEGVNFILQVVADMDSVESLCSIAHVASEQEVLDWFHRLSTGSLIARDRGIIACQRAIIRNPDVGVCRAFLSHPEIRQNVNNLVPENPARGAPTTLLHAAVMRGTDVLHLLLTLPEVDLNVVCTKGLTPLHLACSLSRSDLVESLLRDRRVALSATTLDHRTALHCACGNGNATTKSNSKWEVVRLLVKASATNGVGFLNARDSRGRTALHYAAENNLTAVVTELLVADAGASATNSTNSLVALVLATDGRGRLAVHLAAQKGHREVVSLLLRRAPHTLHAHDDEALSPLHHAVRGGHLQILQDWIPHYVSTSNPLLKTFIELLETTTHYEVAIFLLQELQQQLQGSSSLTFWAIESHSGYGATLIPQILKWQPHLANETLDQERNRTPLHIATISGRLDVVEALCMEQGWLLQVNRKDKFNKTALDYAYALGDRAVCEHLVQRPDVKEYIGMLQKELDTYVMAANAILVVAVLVVGASYASCVKPWTDNNGYASQKYSFMYITVPTTFLTSIVATILAACASLPFSFGLYVGRHSSVWHSEYIGHKVRWVRVLVAFASYFLLLSLATMVFSFSRIVFGMGRSARVSMMVCSVFTVTFVSVTLLAFVSYFSRVIYCRVKQFSFRTRKSFKVPVVV